jgi:hypothetical protein
MNFAEFLRKLREIELNLVTNGVALELVKVYVDSVSSESDKVVNVNYRITNNAGKIITQVYIDIEEDD